MLVQPPTPGMVTHVKHPLPRLLADEQAATTLEWALLLAAIGLPSYFIIQLALNSLVGYYQMMTMLNSLPFP